MSFIKNAFNDLTGKTAADATKEAAGVAAGAQGEAIDYLKQQDQMPGQLREGAMGQLAGLFGLEGGDPNAMSKLEGSPIYQSIMAGQGAGEDAIMRNAAATGGLRSGDVQSALAKFAPQLKAQAIGESMKGLTGFMGMPSQSGNIANLMGQMGMTEAQGITGAAQAKQAGMGSLLSGAGSLLGGIAAFSDARLKKNVVILGSKNGIPWYRWQWDPAAAKFGLTGVGEGHMAHEVAEVRPDAVDTNGEFLMVDYKALETA